jgi:hypothetical protein
MNPDLEQALQKLEDIHLPEAIYWWPLPLSVWVIVIGISGLIIGIVIYQITRHRVNAYRREANSLLDENLAKAYSFTQKITVINSVLKQVAITNYGRSTASHLTGEAWIKFLHTNAKYIKQPPCLHEILCFAHQKIEPNNEQEQQLEAVIEYSKTWIRGHHK